MDRFSLPKINHLMHRMMLAVIWRRKAHGKFMYYSVTMTTWVFSSDAICGQERITHPASSTPIRSGQTLKNDEQHRWFRVICYDLQGKLMC